MSNKKTADDNVRMIERVGKMQNLTLPQVYELIQNNNINNVESYQLISSFFHDNSLKSFPECEQIIQFMVNLIQSQDIQECTHGIRCIFNVLCHKNFTFDLDFTNSLCQKLIHLSATTIYPIILIFIFRTMSFITMISKQHSLIVQSYINPIQLCEFILTQNSIPKVVCCSINLLDKFIIGSENNGAVVINSTFNEVLCQLILKMANMYRAEESVIISLLKCCVSFARKNTAWVTIFERYNLFTNLSQLICEESLLVKENVINLITLSFKHTSSIRNYNLNLIILLINHGNAPIQKAAICCLNECLLKNTGSLPYLMELGLLDQILNCIQNGSAKARTSCVSLLSTMISFQQDLAQVYLDLHLFPILLELIPIIPNDFKTYEKLFHIIKTLVNFVNRTKQQEFYISLITQFEEVNGEEIFEAFMQEDHNELAIESLETVLHSIHSIEEQIVV